MKQLKIYRVVDITLWGHEDNPLYFKSPIVAEKEFHRRLKKGITDPALPKHDGDERPWTLKINSKDREKMKATIRYWDSYETPECGRESDIKSYDILFEEITVV